jgi:Domain of unknown function (DUF4156)
MKNLIYSSLLIGAALLPAACTWVEPSVSGDAVRVVYEGNVTGCRDAGTVAVTVADKIAFYHRSETKVRDELETMARNEAANLPADTIKAISEPHEGSQRFQAYVCGRVQVRQRDASRVHTVTPPPQDGVQTFPIKEH